MIHSLSSVVNNTDPWLFLLPKLILKTKSDPYLIMELNSSITPNLNCKTMTCGMDTDKHTHFLMIFLLTFERTTMDDFIRCFLNAPAAATTIVYDNEFDGT